MSNERDKSCGIRQRKHRCAFRLPAISVDRLMEELGIPEPIRETLGTLLRQLATDNESSRVYTDAATQTPVGDICEEIHTVETSTKRVTDETVTDETKPKMPFEEFPVKDPENSTEESPYDNIPLKAPVNLAYGNFSLQIRERLNTEENRRPFSAVLNRKTYDERECLANALQFNIEELVDGVIFQDSELPDCLLAEGCLTEDECSTVRKHRDRKDQIRTLVSLINGRDVHVLRGFLKHIKAHNQDVAAKIEEKFEDNKRKGLGQKLCYLCQLKNNFNVKHLADCLWAEQVIDKGLYNTIISSDLSIGAQETLWREVIHSLNYLNHREAEIAHQKFLEAISRRNLFIYLADGIKEMLIKNHGRLACSCAPKPFITMRDTSSDESTSGESFIPRSSSDGTTNDTTTTYWTDDRTICKTIYKKPCSITSENQLFPTSLFQSSFNQHDVGHNSIPETVEEEGSLEFNSQTFVKS